MFVHQWVGFSQEVPIEIHADDILAAFTETPDPGETWLQAINRFALCLNALPDETIATWTPRQRALIQAFLTKHTARFA